MNISEWLNSLKENRCPTMAESISVLSRTVPLLLELESAVQDSRWHGEGNVLIHTDMVLKELYHLLELNPQIAGERRQALILGAVFHDIAKPVTTRESEINGELRITAPRHEDRGRSYLSFLLMELPLSFETVWSILNLVGEHGKPKKLVQKGTKGDFFRLSRIVDLELLYLLESADMRGRISDDTAKNCEAMELFALFAQEYRCWNEDPYSGWITALTAKIGVDSVELDAAAALAKEDFESGKISSYEEAEACSYKFRQGFSDVVILCGLSGSGKSTYIAKHYPDYSVVSLDSIRKELYGCETIQGDLGTVLQTAKERLKQSLRKQGKVVWDATSIRKDFRSQVIDLTKNYGGITTIVLFLMPLNEIRSNNQKRPRTVPEEILRKQISSFELPTVDESDRFIIVNGSQEILLKEGFYSK